jgi:hypothetical protein
MRFIEDSQRISLKGVKQDLTKCTPLSGPRLKGLHRKVVTHCVQFKLAAEEVSQVDYDEAHAIKAVLTEQEVLLEIKQLLEDYADLFQTPTTLPPHR